MVDPEFSLYRRALERVDDSAPRWRSNPHSPTGLLAGAEETAGVWDEAFFPLATGRWTRGDHRDGATVVGSLTKLFACPGLRVGYVIAPDDRAADDLRRLQPEWSVSALATESLCDLLDTTDLTAWSAAVVKLRSELVDLFVHHDLAVRDTDANWVLVDDATLRDRLMVHGIASRDCSSFGWSRRRPGRRARRRRPGAAGGCPRAGPDMTGGLRVGEHCGVVRSSGPPIPP